MYLSLIKVLLLFSVFVLSTLANAKDNLRICIPEQDVPPFYVHHQEAIGGTSVEHLQFLFKQPQLENISYQLIPQPWQRCLKSIEEGKVDLVIAGHSTNRSQIGLFPDSIGFELSSSAFSYAQICLVKRTDSAWSWNGKEIVDGQNLTLGIEPGFLIPSSHRSDKIAHYFSIWDSDNKYELVKKQRVDAVLSVCGVLEHKVVPDQNKLSDQLTVVYPPYISSPAYLLFSKAYYQAQPDITKLIITTSNQLDKNDIQYAISR